MCALTLQLLGSPQLKLDGVSLPVRRRKSLALLTYLAVTERTHTRSSLAALFWPENDPFSARANLRRALSDLNNILAGNGLEFEVENVKLSCSIRLDVKEFKTSLHAWRTHIHPEATCAECVRTLEEGIVHYQDDFMKGFDLADCPEFDDWQFFEREGLRNEFSEALAWFVDALALGGAYERAIPYARRWVSLDPLHEPAQQMLMRLYELAGQRAAALRQYAECQRVLDEELGFEPAEKTRELHKAILANRVQPPEKTELKARMDLRGTQA